MALAGGGDSATSASSALVTVMPNPIIWWLIPGDVIKLEYASTVWSPHTATDITKLEAVQRRSAPWATSDYQRTSSVTQMIKDLNWRTLEQRRIDSRLTLIYKITYDLVAIPAADNLIPNQDTTTY